jgi:two-component system, chemotaxis family, sensor kinase CheA
MDQNKYIQLYLSEGREHLSSLTSGLASEKGIKQESISELFRNAHSLKGMAAAMSFESTSRLAHELENILGVWRSGGVPAPADKERALRATDLLESLFQEVEKKGNDSGLESEVAEWFNAKGTGVKEENTEKPRQFELEPEKPAELPKSKTLRIKVAIDPESQLPAARLLIVFQKIKSVFESSQMIPPLSEIQKSGLKSADFTVSEHPELKNLARLIQALPEVVQVEIMGADAGETKGSLVSTIRLPASTLDDLLVRISHLLYHMNTLETALPPEEKRSQKFWLESHRSQLHQLYNEILEARLVSFDSLIERLERAVRDLSSRTGKKLKLKVEGKGEKVDKLLLEKLLDPLMHLVRNGADHGIEAPEDRKKTAKPAEGTLFLTIKREGEKLTIVFEDDGKGLDIEGIKESALMRGIINRDKAEKLSTREILELITLPSFSTKTEVTQISGRGVGLDVVRSSVESLGGKLEMESEKGKGSKFLLIFPSAVTLTEVLVFSWSPDLSFAIPTSQVTKLYPLTQYPISWVEGTKKLRVDDRFLDILNFRLLPVGKSGIAVGLEIESREVVLLVSEVKQTERVVVLPWGSPLERIPHLIGGALLTTGEIVFILDGASLAREEMEAINVFQTK